MGIESYSVLRLGCDNGMACDGTARPHPTSSNPLVLQRDAKAQGWMMGINHQGLFLTFCPARACQKRGREVFGIKVGDCDDACIRGERACNDLACQRPRINQEVADRGA